MFRTLKEIVFSHAILSIGWTERVEHNASCYEPYTSQYLEVYPKAKIDGTLLSRVHNIIVIYSVNNNLWYKHVIQMREYIVLGIYNS